MTDVCVVGLGYVGLPTASLLASSGAAVLGVDCDPAVVELLRPGKTRLEEAGLATLVEAAVRSGNLVAATEPAAAETFIICVPTPITDEATADLGAVEDAARAIAPLLASGNLVILESTSPVGTTRNVVRPILEESGLVCGHDFDLCYCPERVLPGNTVAEMIHNDRVIGGLTPEAARRARSVYERFCRGPALLTSDLSAEMSKLMENTYRDVNVALANVFSRIAEEAGVDVWEAIALANRHPRVSILDPGPGVGGHCIPVDPWFLVGGFPDHAGLVSVARTVNDTQADRLFDRIRQAAPFAAGGHLAILGAAYKGDIDDARESPVWALASAATRGGVPVRVHDPHVQPEQVPGLPLTGNLEECLDGAAAAVLLTAHRAYRDLSPTLFGEHMVGRLIADGRNGIDREAFRSAGFQVLVLGDGSSDGAAATQPEDRAAKSTDAMRSPLRPSP